MPSPKHAASKSDSGYCCNCASAVGPEAKVQPTSCDGEIWCPRCFTWKRAALEPERFNSSQTAAVRCQFCAWVTISFGARPGMGLICSHCRSPGALRIPIDPEDAMAAKKVLEG